MNTPHPELVEVLVARVIEQRRRRVAHVMEAILKRRVPARGDWATLLETNGADEDVARVELVRLADESFETVRGSAQEWHRRIADALDLAHGVVARARLDDGVDRDGLRVALGWIAAFDAVCTARVVTCEYALELISQKAVTYATLSDRLQMAGIGVDLRTLTRWVTTGVPFRSPHDPTSQLLRRHAAAVATLEDLADGSGLSAAREDRPAHLARR